MGGDGVSGDGVSGDGVSGDGVGGDGVGGDGVGGDGVGAGERVQVAADRIDRPAPSAMERATIAV